MTEIKEKKSATQRFRDYCLLVFYRRHCCGNSRRGTVELDPKSICDGSLYTLRLSPLFAYNTWRLENSSFHRHPCSKISSCKRMGLCWTILCLYGGSSFSHCSGRQCFKMDGCGHLRFNDNGILVFKASLKKITFRSN